MFSPELRKKPYSIKLDTVVLLLFFFQFLIGQNNFLCNNIFLKIIFYRAFIKTKFMQRQLINDFSKVLVG